MKLYIKICFFTALLISLFPSRTFSSSKMIAKKLMPDAAYTFIENSIKQQTLRIPVGAEMSVILSSQMFYLTQVTAVSMSLSGLDPRKVDVVPAEVLDQINFELKFGYSDGYFYSFADNERNYYQQLNIVRGEIENLIKLGFESDSYSGAVHNFVFAWEQLLIIFEQIFKMESLTSEYQATAQFDAAIFLGASLNALMEYFSKKTLVSLEGGLPETLDMELFADLVRAHIVRDDTVPSKISGFPFISNLSINFLNERFEKIDLLMTALYRQLPPSHQRDKQLKKLIHFFLKMRETFGLMNAEHVMYYNDNPSRYFFDITKSEVRSTVRKF